MDKRLTDTLRRIETPSGVILAFDCPCGEGVEPGQESAIVRWDEPVSGIEHSICHVGCLEREEVND